MQGDYSHVHNSELTGSEILIQMSSNSSVFWEIKPCSPVKVNRYL
jgi:hypothetical protein